MQIKLERGARTAPTALVPFPLSVVDFDEVGVVLSLDGESEVRIEFRDWETGLASVGYWRGEEYVVQSGGQNLVDVDPAGEQVFVFLRVARLESTRALAASFDAEDETRYDGRLGFRFRASNSSKILWDVTDPFAGFELSTLTTRDDDLEQATGEIVAHGNSKYYFVQGFGEQEDGSYGLQVSELVFPPEELNQRCRACEEPE
jgi:hypothetical protein